MIPFCNIYSAFSQRAYDNIIHDVAIEKQHVVFCFDRAGIVGEDGATHHGAFDLAALRPIPHLTICAPMNECELRKMMFTAQLPDQGPWVIRYPRGRGVLTDWKCPLEALEIGKGRKIKDGHGTVVLSIGHIGNNVVQAVKDTDVAHYDMRFLKPLDTSILDEVGKNFSHVITIEDGVKDGGLGSAVLEYFADKGYTPRVTRLGMPSDNFVEHGKISELQKLCGMDVDGIVAAIRS